MDRVINLLLLHQLAIDRRAGFINSIWSNDEKADSYLWIKNNSTYEVEEWEVSD